MEDLAVGSYFSGHSVIFRSRPVARLGLTLSTRKNAATGGDSIEGQTCSQYDPKDDGKPILPEICILLNNVICQELNNQLILIFLH